ncbi:DUF305 domain-containing protein [Rhodocaloribacter litoris]|uniref:DUF305 domain-containing protein n=1 Tax=Rhodocaloribacter litoris TaxID=2558931 RepID=UPI001420A837|nr:DUF305 domain-containing protein [Rhodocaloribacter litoris]QXD14122.1 DUF305 domain-containing protein [Rhodocaloribacter litoris]
MKHVLLPLLLVLALAGCRSTEPMTPAPAADTATPATAGLEALYWARQDSARTRFTEADVHFVTGMIVHHAQALVMSALAPTHDAGPAVRRLTARILNAQRDEIATMQQWLRDRGLTVPDIEIDGIRLTVHGVDHHMMHMPGMLSQAQLEALDAARGPEFDRLFLEYMIQHHQGAVDMVEELFATDGAALDEQVFKLASDIQVDQRTEIERMRLMLQQMNGAGR